MTGQAASHAEACALLADARRRVARNPADAAEVFAEYLLHPAAVWEGAPGARADVLVAAAIDQLDRAARGDMGALAEAVGTLVTVLDEAPSHRDQVTDALTAYQASVRTADPCHARDNLSWFNSRDLAHTELTLTGQAIGALAPQVLLDCGDQLLPSDPEQALHQFQLVVADYPDHPLAAEAERKVETAEDILVQRDLSRLLGGWPAEETKSGRYCEEPVGYPEAPRYSGPGPHRVVAVAPHAVRSTVPSSWKAGDFTDAVLVLCGDDAAPGTVLGSCDYLNDRAQPPESVTVTLNALSYRMRFFELRTGRQVGETTVEFGGDCPPRLYTEPDGSIPDFAMPSYFDEDIFRARIRQWVFP